MRLMLLSLRDVSMAALPRKTAATLSVATSHLILSPFSSIFLRAERTRSKVASMCKSAPALGQWFKSTPCYHPHFPLVDTPFRALHHTASALDLNKPWDSQ
jgi:hypothetical protein